MTATAPRTIDVNRGFPPEAEAEVRVPATGRGVLPGDTIGQATAPESSTCAPATTA